MSGAHTPGPWFWAMDSRNQPTALMRSGAGDYVITPQADVGDYGLSVDPWNDVSEADAALVATAPELLAGLLAAVDLIVQITQARWSEWEATEEETVGGFRAVIAKATTVT